LLGFLDENFCPQQGKPLEALHDVYIGLVGQGILEELDLRFVEAWINDLGMRARRDNESDRDPPT
jgi:hypothetical protein